MRQWNDTAAPLNLKSSVEEWMLHKLRGCPSLICVLLKTTISDITLKLCRCTGGRRGRVFNTYGIQISLLSCS
ncbi:hypothetical protein SUGI_0188380 [Cryptomeria japonica]|nr:hypothetical protein SUGI_0188380 [Cryptomeria japonica]